MRSESSLDRTVAMSRGCAVGIDPGERWIGVARAGMGSSLALPVGTLDRGAGHNAIVQALRNLLCGEEVSVLVIGVPLRGDGLEDAQATAFREFGEVLASALGATCLPQDERSSSDFDSVAGLVGNVDRGRKARSPGRRSVQRQRRDRERSHATAAARILQRWLDSEEGRRARMRLDAET